jgi:hypothetical protein
MEAIRSLLRFEWNPAGGDPVEDARDRYDGYALRLFSMMYSRPDERRVADYLDHVQTAELGFPPTPEHNRAVARRMIALFDPDVEGDGPDG